MVFVKNIRKSFKMSLSKNVKIRNILYVVAIVLVCIMFFLGLPKHFIPNNLSIFTIITFTINLIFFIFCFFDAQRKNIYSLNCMVWIFSIFFFFISPVLQYLNSNFPWDYVPSDLVIIKTNLIILLFSLVYEIVYLRDYQNIKQKFFNKGQMVEDDINFKTLKILSYISLIFVAIIVIRVDFSDWFSKYNIGKAYDIFGISSLSNLFSQFAVYYTAIVFLFNFVEILKTRKINTGNLCSVYSFFVVCFPFSLTRFVLATLYMGIIMVIFKNNRLVNRCFNPLFIILMVCVFPIMGQLSHLNFENNDFFSIISKTLNNIQGTYLSGDYDAFYNLANIIEYVDVNGSTRGLQLLGCLLFFVPRKWWISKPIGTGAYLANQTGRTFTNISMPFIGEGYANFGICGILIFSLFLGKMFAYCDKRYWDNRNSILKLMYPMMVIYSFILLRGDLMTGISGFFYLMITWLIVYFSIIKLNSKKVKYIKLKM